MDDIQVLARVKAMDNYKPTELFFDNITWVPEKKKKNPEHKGKKNYFRKWIDKKMKVGAKFTLQDFYKDYPKHKTDSSNRKRLERTIHELIVEKKLAQMEKGKFQVIK
jgi:hypothetical protein